MLIHHYCEEIAVNDPTQKVIDHLRALSARAFELIHDFEARRKLIDLYFRVHPSTATIHGQWYSVKTGHIPMEWVLADGVDPHRRILYMHGGSWISGSLAGYRAFLSHISQSTGAGVLAVDYRLAPEHKFPAGLDDCIQAYQWMWENGPDGKAPATAAFLMGDSAGGNLTLAALLKCKAAKLPLPTAVVVISPPTDFTGGSPSLETRAAVDPIINPAVMQLLIPVYLGKHTEPTNPYASPLFGDYDGMPPMLIQVGDLEVLLDESTRLAKHAAEQGCEVTLQVWDGMPHVFQGFIPFLPKACEAVAEIGEFIRRH
jgi:acetyl esterase/lipase